MQIFDNNIQIIDKLQRSKYSKSKTNKNNGSNAYTDASIDLQKNIFEIKGVGISTEKPKTLRINSQGQRNGGSRKLKAVDLIYNRSSNTNHYFLTDKLQIKNNKNTER